MQSRDIVTCNIISIISVRKGQKRKPSLTANIIFNDENCSVPTQFIPCQENDQTFLEITNNGDSTSQGILCFKIPGHQDTYVQIGDDFAIGADETLMAQITFHFSSDYWTETKDITLDFAVGYRTGPDEMQPTDTIEFQTQIYVENGNGGGDGCEDYLTESDCTNNNCYWYAYPNPFGEKSCHGQQMMMAYLPYALIGIGGVILVLALVSGQKKQQYYPAPYRPPTEYGTLE